MNFFRAQEQARSLSVQLIVLFIGAVFFLAFATTSLVIFLGPYLRLPIDMPSMTEILRGDVSMSMKWKWPSLIFFSLTLLISLASAIKYWALSVAGTQGIAEGMGGRLISFDQELLPPEKVLRNIVEEMAISASIPVPLIFILDEEPGINSAAIGLSIDDSAIVVTLGFLKGYSRSEAQAVIAHEVSHILNGDMRLNLNMVAILHGILFFTHTGKKLLKPMRSNLPIRKNPFVPLPLVVIGIILFTLGSVGHFLGRLIKASISRQREFLADATAVQLTRNPLALSTALTKLLTWETTKLLTRSSIDFSHSFIGAAQTVPTFSWLASHPSLKLRIEAINPGWLKRNFPPKILKTIMREPLTTMLAIWGHDDRLSFLTTTLSSGSSALAHQDTQNSTYNASNMAEEAPITPQTPHGHLLVTQTFPKTLRPENAHSFFEGDQESGKKDSLAQNRSISRLIAETSHRAQNFLTALPPDLYSKFYESQEVERVLLALIMSIYPGVNRLNQKTINDAGIFQNTDEFLVMCAKFSCLEIPSLTHIISLALPAFRQFTHTKKYSFLRLIYQIFTSDRHLELFEWTCYIYLRKGLGFPLSLDYESPPPTFLSEHREKIAGSMYIIALFLATLSTYPLDSLPLVLDLKPPFDLNQIKKEIKMEDLTYATLQIGKLPKKSITKFLNHCLFISRFNEEFSDNEYDILNALCVSWGFNLRQLGEDPPLDLKTAA